MLLRDYLAKYYAATALRYLASVLELGDEEEIENMEVPVLIEREAERLLTPEVMASRLASLTEREMELFEQACRGPIQLAPDEWEAGQNLNGCRYAFLTYEDDDTLLSSLSGEAAAMFEMQKALRRISSDRLEVPEDAAALYNRLNTPEFQKRRRDAFHLLRCLDISRVLYGSVPVSVLRRMLKQEYGEEISEETILSLYDFLPRDAAFAFYDSATRRITREYIRDAALEALIRKQAGIDFYIPTSAEAEELYKKECLTQSPAYLRYQDFLVNYCGLDWDGRESAAAELWMRISESKAHEEGVQEMLETSGADPSCLKLILTLYHNCYEETRIQALCGHTPPEMRAACPERAAEFSLGGEFEITIDMEPDVFVRTIRIGRNDPCPCGSGKKYKKCCLR